MTGRRWLAGKLPRTMRYCPSVTSTGAAEKRWRKNYDRIAVPVSFEANKGVDEPRSAPGGKTPADEHADNGDAHKERK